jgi:hypothetical protein
MAKPKYQPVLVEWADSAAYSRWRSIEGYREATHPSQCISVGFLLLKDEKRVVILQSEDGDEHGEVAEALAIPRACVKRIRYLYPKGGTW